MDTTPNWDMIQSAAAYSTLSGILAGFALTAVTVVVTVVAGGRRHLSPRRLNLLAMTAGWLIIAFFSLLLVSFLFAVLSGHDRFVTTVDPTTHQLDYGAKTMQPLMLGLPVSILFSSAAIQLFLGIVWLFELVNLGNLTQVCARIMFWFLIPLSAVHIHSYYGTIEEERTNQAPPQSLQFWFIAIAAVAVPILVFGLVRLLGRILGRRNRAKEVMEERKHMSESVPKFTIQHVPAVIALCLTLVVGISFGVFENVSESTFADPNFDLYGVMIVVYAVLAVLWTLYVLSLPKRAPMQKAAGSDSTAKDTASQHASLHQSIETQIAGA